MKETTGSNKGLIGAYVRGILKFPISIFFFFKGEEGRENARNRNINARNMDWLPFPNWGPSLQPKHVPLPGIEPVTLGFAGRPPTN